MQYRPECPYSATLADNGFGIVHVDFETQKRTVKDSGYWWRDLMAKGENEYVETLV